jgi:hypothetical protein
MNFTSKSKQIQELRDKIKEMENTFYVYDYFSKRFTTKLLRSDAVSFERVSHDLFDRKYILTYYTTVKNYEEYKPVIKKWQKEVDKIRKENQ